MQALRADARRNRARILAAARDQFAELGTGARMDGIAAAAGVAVGTLYRHFPTKEALLEAALAERLTEGAAAARAGIARVAGGADPAAEIDALVHWYAGVQQQDRAWKTAAAEAGLEPDMDSAEVRDLLAAVGELLERAQAAGRIRPDLVVTDLTLLLAGLPGPEVPPDARARYLDVLLSGLRPR